jgi:spore germination cell wall hydrolase CwlJ-like protein
LKNTIIVILTFIILICIILGLSTLVPRETDKIIYKANYNLLSKEHKKQVDCLAENIYFESAHEPNKGKIAVAFVTINRVNSNLFENNICGVVKQRNHNVCQFSWWCQEREKAMSEQKVLTNGNNLLYNDIRNIALYVYMNYEKLEDPTKGALFYHADYVDPKWKNMKHMATIGQHIFYNVKEKK